MKNPVIFLFVIFICISMTTIDAQTLEVVKASYFDKTPPLREMKMILPGERDRTWKDGIVINRDVRKTDYTKETLPLGADPLWQQQMGRGRWLGAIHNFEGVSNLNGLYPPDTEGDKGPDHYFQMVNVSFAIYDENGNLLYGPADNSTLWDGFIGPWTGTNDGDPIVLYDEFEDRWLASQFAVNTSDGSQWIVVAISETGDPTGAYYRYAFEFTYMPDYPKFGIWPDGYYMSLNLFDQNSGYPWMGTGAVAMEKDKMLTGDPNAQMILFTTPPNETDPWSMLPCDLDGTNLPPAGSPNYFACLYSDSWDDVTDDYIEIWEFSADWDTPANSTFGLSETLFVTPYDMDICNAFRGRCMDQPDTDIKLEGLNNRLMYRLQYRNFGSYQTLVTNHTVDFDGQGHAGIRWYELRKIGSWSIYQEGTYAPDMDHRWMGSAAMNGDGSIGLGYSVSSTTTYPSIRFTGRRAADPLGVMTMIEQEVMAGTGSQTGTAARWGDYSMMAIDPVDDVTFWYTQEYIQHTGATSWQTRVAAFQIDTDFTPPAAIDDLTPTITTTNLVDLQWTAPGDDGNTGTAHAYDMRYSTSEITDANFNAALQLPNPPIPQPAGSIENYTVEGLDYNTTYWFAIKSEDEWANISDISNVEDVTTPLPPEIVVNPLLLEENLYTGATASQNINIENIGNSDLIVNLLVDYTTGSRDNILKANQVPPVQKFIKHEIGPKHESVLSYTIYNNEYHETPIISNRAASDSIYYDDGNEFVRGFIGYNGTNPIWAAQRFSPLADFILTHISVNYRTELSTDPVSVDIYLGGATPDLGTLIHSQTFNGLSEAGQFFYIPLTAFFEFETGEDFWVVMGYDISIPFPQGTDDVGSGDYEDRSYYSSNNIGWGLLGDIFADGSPDAWVIRAVEDIPEAWLTVDPISATIEPSANLDVDAIFDAAGLPSDMYTAQIQIESNDPVTPQQIVDATLTVTGAPNIVVVPDELDFGVQLTSTPHIQTINISNDGIDPLNVTSIISDLPDYVPDPTNFTLNPTEDQDVTITFTPASVGNLDATLTINSDDPDEDPYEVTMLGAGGTEPTIATDPDSVYANLFTGETIIKNLAIQNTNPDGINLEFTIEIQEKDTRSYIPENIHLPSPKRIANIHKDARFVEDEVIVGFKEGITGSDVMDMKMTMNANLKTNLTFINAEVWKISALTVREAVERFSGDTRIRYIEPNYLVHINDIPPNDLQFIDQWGFDNTGQMGGTPGADISATEAWEYWNGQTTVPVVVGVIDTGVDYYHEDLALNMWQNPGEIPNNGIDDDLNGFVDDVYGWDFVHGDNDPDDDHSHGTHVSGTIAAVTNNNVGVAGTCWTAKIMAIKCFDEWGWGETVDMIKSVRYATNNGAKVSNNSYGGGDYSQAFMDAITTAMHAGQLFVAAAGNNGMDNDATPYYPASYNVDGILAVAATNNNDVRASFSNWGATSVDIGAPGKDILSTTPGNTYSYKDGTSMSAPHAAGVAALIWSVNPYSNNIKTKQAIENGVDPVPDLGGKCVTGGRLNAYNALMQAANNWIQVWPEAGTVQGGELFNIDVVFDATGLGTGLYEVDIVIGSNASNAPELRVPASLAVTGAPDISVYPLTYDFGDIFRGFPDTVEMTVSNNGADELTVTSIVADNPAYDFIPDNFTLDAGEVEVIDIIANPTVLGSINGTATINSDDPDDPVINVDLIGESYDPPLIDTNPYQVVDTVGPDETSNKDLNIINDGASTLDFEIYLMNFTSPGMTTTPQMVAAPCRETYNSDVSPNAFASSASNVITTTRNGNEIYKIDDGSFETTVGLTAGGDFMWLNAFEVIPEFAIITSISVTWGGGIPAGEDCRLIIYDDPNNDGGPGDAEYLTEVTTTVISPGTGQFFIVPIPATYVEGTFFVAALYQNQQPGEYPAPLDESSYLWSSWVVGEGTQGNFDVYNLLNNGLAPTTTWDINLPGNWLLRADAIGWLSVTPATGSIAPGKLSQEVDVGFNSAGLGYGDYTADIEIHSNDPATPVFTVPVTLTIYEEGVHNVYLAAGWSGISSYIAPDDPLVVNIFEPVVDDLVILQDPNNAHVYWPGFANTIVNWNPHDGYIIKMSDEGTVLLEGSNEPDLTVDLPAGWFVMPVLAQNDVPSADLFTPLLGDLVIVKEIAGSKVWWPLIPIYTLTHVEPGKSYQIKMNNPGVLNYTGLGQSPQRQSSGYDKGMMDNPTPWNDVVETPITQTIAVKKDMIGNIHPGDYIGVLTSEKLCAGMVKVPDEAGSFVLTVFGDDITTVEVKDGFLEEEQMLFRLYRPATKEEYFAEPTFDQDLPNYTGVFEKDGLSAITDFILTPTGITEGSALDHVMLYPNPAKERLYIQYKEDIILHVRMLDAFGKEVLHDQIVSSSFVNTSKLSSGIYFVEIMLPNGDDQVWKKVVIE